MVCPEASARRKHAGKRTAELGGQALAAFGTSAVDQGATVGSAHAGTETVGTLSADFAGLIGSFHDAQSPSEYRN